jgi:hypothetical protein
MRAARVYKRRMIWNNFPLLQSPPWRQRRAAYESAPRSAAATAEPLTLAAAVAAGSLQTAQAGRAYIQRSCQERKHLLGAMQELGAFACGPPVELLPTHNRCRLSEKAVTGVTLFRFGAP